MGLCASSNIFQDILENLLGDIEGVNTYIDDILVLGKGSFYQHIGQIRVIFSRIRVKVVKVNAPKCKFVLKNIPYLVYIIKIEGIKPDPKKVKGIMNIGIPTTMIEARALTRMVQYYSEMWPRRSHVL